MDFPIFFKCLHIVEQALFINFPISLHVNLGLASINVFICSESVTTHLPGRCSSSRLKLPLRNFTNHLWAFLTFIVSLLNYINLLNYYQKTILMNTNEGRIATNMNNTFDKLCQHK